MTIRTCHFCKLEGCPCQGNIQYVSIRDLEAHPSDHTRGPGRHLVKNANVCTRHQVILRQNGFQVTLRQYGIRKKGKKL